MSEHLLKLLQIVIFVYILMVLSLCESLIISQHFFPIKSLRMQEKSIQFTTSNSKVISPGIPECGEQCVFKIQSKKSHWVWPWTSSQQRLSRKASLCWFYLVKFILPFNVCKRFRLSGRVKFVARGSVLEIVFLSCRN